MLPFIVSPDISPIGNKVPDREFYWRAIMNFIQDWESEIVNKCSLEASSSENGCYCTKMKTL